VDGWSTGLWFDIGAAAEVSDVWIHRTRLGVLIDDADVSVVRSRIDARDSAVYVGRGRPLIDGNILYGFLGQAIALAPGATYSGQNQVYPRSGCFGPGCLPWSWLGPQMRADHPGWAPAPAEAPPRRGRR
jgi:hypothetical protein